MLLVGGDTRAETRACLTSLPIAVNDGLRYEVIAVDLGSRDGSAELLASWPGVRLIRATPGLGYAAAVNHAYRCARGALVLLLDASVAFEPGALSSLVRFLHRRPEVPGVAPLFARGVGADLDHPHYQALPDLRTALALTTALRRLPSFARAVEAYEMRDVDFSRPRQVDQPSVRCLLLRRAALGPDGLFDKHLPFYAQDALLAHGLATRGRRLWMTPESVVTVKTPVPGGRGPGPHDAISRHRHTLAGLVRQLRATQPPRRVRAFQALVATDWLVRRLLRRSPTLSARDVRAALRGDVRTRRVRA